MVKFEEQGEDLETQLLFLARLLLSRNLTKHEKAFLRLLTTNEHKCSQLHRFQLNCQQQKPSGVLSTQANPILGGETNNLELGLRWGWMYILSFKRRQRFSPVGELAVGIRTGEIWRMASFQQRENVIYHFTESDIGWDICLCVLLYKFSFGINSKYPV